MGAAFAALLRRVVPSGILRRGRGPLAALLAALLLAVPVTGHTAPSTKTRPPPAPAEKAEVADKQQDLKELRGQIEALRKELSAAEGSRAEVADQLKDAERSISQTQRELYRLGEKREELQQTLGELAMQSRELEQRLGSQQSQLEKLVHRQYLRGNPDALRLLLNGSDPNQLARDLHYLAAIGRARGLLLREIDSNLQRKQALTTQAREREEQLAAIAARQKEEHARLLSQREQRKATLQKISTRIAAQRQEIGSLQRDEKRLSQLIDRLAKIIAARAEQQREAERRAAREAAREAARQAAKPGAREGERKPATAPAQGPARPPGEIANEHTPEGVRGGAFASLRGSLRLPVRGTVSNRFGSPRQEGSNWKGLFIKAANGSEVKSIAAGRVVFAEWMRGFGNLLIVDHGDSYLSIYGNNESLLKQVGDSVRGGDTVAAVGNSGGNPESGLYFELRHQGQPQDPLRWVSLK